MYPRSGARYAEKRSEGSEDSTTRSVGKGERGTKRGGGKASLNKLRLFRYIWASGAPLGHPAAQSSVVMHIAQLSSRRLLPRCEEKGAGAAHGWRVTHPWARGRVGRWEREAQGASSEAPTSPYSGLVSPAAPRGSVARGLTRRRRGGMGALTRFYRM